MSEKEMTDAEVAAHLRRYVTGSHGAFSWPTDGCGYKQHIRFVIHRNKNWHGNDAEGFRAFVLDYAAQLDAGKERTS